MLGLKKLKARREQKKKETELHSANQSEHGWIKRYKDKKAQKKAQESVKKSNISNYTEENKTPKGELEPTPGYAVKDDKGERIEFEIHINGNLNSDALKLTIDNPLGGAELPKGTDEKIQAHAEDGSGTYDYHITVRKKDEPAFTPITHSNVAGAMPEEDLSSLEPGDYEIIVTVEDSTNTPLTQEKRIKITIKPEGDGGDEEELIIDSPNDGAELPKDNPGKVTAHIENPSGEYDYGVIIHPESSDGDVLDEKGTTTDKIEKDIPKNLDEGDYLITVVAESKENSSRIFSKAIKISIKNVDKEKDSLEVVFNNVNNRSDILNNIESIYIRKSNSELIEFNPNNCKVKVNQVHIDDWEFKDREFNLSEAKDIVIVKKDSCELKIQKIEVEILGEYNLIESKAKGKFQITREPLNLNDNEDNVIEITFEKDKTEETNFEVILKDQRGFKPGLAEEVIIYIKQGSSTPIHLRMKTDQHGVARKEISLRETTQFITKELRCISFFDKIDYEILEVNQISPEEKKAKKGEVFILNPEKKDYKFEVIVRRKYLELAAKDSNGKPIPNLNISGFSVRDSNGKGPGGHSTTEEDGIIYLGPLSFANKYTLYTENLSCEEPWSIIGVTQTAPRGGPQKKIPGKDVICKSSGKDKEFKVDLILIKDTARPKRILWIRVQDGPSKKANLVPDFVLEDVEVEENKKVTNIGTLKTGSENAGQLKGMAKAYIAEGYVKLNTEKIKSGSPKWKIVACYPTTKNPIGPKDKYMESIVVVNSIKISGRIINGDATAANKVPLDSTGEYLNDIWHKEVVPINAKECTIKLFQGNQEVKDIIVNPEVDGTFTISKVPSAMNYYVHVTYEGKNYMHYVNKDNVRYQRGGNNQPDNSAPPAPINTDKNPKHINVVVDVNGPSSESELVIGLEKAKHNLNWEELDTNRKIIIQSKETGKEIGSKSIKDIIGSDNKWSLSKKGVVTKVSNEQAGLGSSKDVTSSINSSDNKWSISLDRSVVGHTWVVSLDRDDEDTRLESAELDSKHLGINSQKKVEITLAQENNDMLLYLGKSSTYKFDTKFKSGKTTYTPLKELSRGSGGVWATFPVRIKNKEQRQLSLGFDTKDVRCVPNNLFPHIIKMPLDRVITSIDAWDSWVVALKVKDPKFGKINSNQLRHNNFDLSVTEIPPNKVIDLEICVFLPHNLILHRGSVVPTFTFYFTPLDMEGHPVTQYSQEIEIKAEKIVSDLDEVQPTQDGELLPSKNFLKKSKIIGHKNVTYDFDEDIIPDLKRLSFSLKGLEPDIEFIKTITSPSGRTNQRWALASHLSALKQKLNIKGRFKAVNKRLNKIKEYLLEDKKMVYLKEHADPVAKLLLEQRYIEILKTKGYNDFKTPLNKEIESIVNLINLIDSNYIKFEEDIKTINAETEGNLAHETITIFEQLHVIEESIFQLSVDLKVILNISQ